ncbi:hypothetical protein [Pelagicoccus sp. SDUM812003]|uniref:DUF6958 family protein n=1 Tax=Pelagicoccus sp. SDUM812003 TaxID=3041267 RepID=UPI00280E6C9B|nr:hypothetical protein [Pelagicoccus sp. SDUM812003]MDQ8201832.1 hypothetical protein [Pelagicoccus sp. SDUM812003]
MKHETVKVQCSTPTPGKKPTRILKWKYESISAAIIKILSARANSGVRFSELSGLVENLIGDEVMKELGSASWYTTTVKLDLEAKGIVQRVPGSSPQVIKLSDKASRGPQRAI